MAIFDVRKPVFFRFVVLHFMEQLPPGLSKCFCFPVDVKISWNFYGLKASK